LEPGELKERRGMRGLEGERTLEGVGALVEKTPRVEDAGEVSPEARLAGRAFGRSAEKREPLVVASEEMQVESGVVEDEGVVGTEREEAFETDPGARVIAPPLGVESRFEFEREDAVGRRRTVRTRAWGGIHTAIIPRALAAEREGRRKHEDARLSSPPSQSFVPSGRVKGGGRG